MNSEMYMSVIEEKLYILQKRIEVRASLNILNLNIRSEEFYKELFNLVYDYHFVNANKIEVNHASVDLVDEENKVVLQISSTATKQKIESSLKQNVVKQKYNNFTFLFMFIGKENKTLFKKKYENPFHVYFDPSLHIYDVNRLIKDINGLDIVKLKAVYDLVNDYFVFTWPNVQRVTSLLPKVILLLCNQSYFDVFFVESSVEIYDINEKIHFNHLVKTKPLIDQYIPYTYVMNKIYDELDRSGKLKSIALLMKISDVYHELSLKIKDSNELFFKMGNILVEEVNQDKMLIDANISYEEIEMCINILLVDAFIKCKIFKRPERKIHNDFK